MDERDRSLLHYRRTEHRSAGGEDPAPGLTLEKTVDTRITLLAMGALVVTLLVTKRPERIEEAQAPQDGAVTQAQLDAIRAAGF
jgi:hypothetical protein